MNKLISILLLVCLAWLPLHADAIIVGYGNTPAGGGSIFDGMTNTINDNFNRASIGANWTNTGIGYSDLTIIANTYVQSGEGVYEGMNWAASIGNDQYAKVDITDISTNLQQIYLMVRSSETVLTSYYASITAPNGVYTLVMQKWVSGTSTELARTTVGTKPVSMRFGVKGTSLELQTYNGSTWTTVLTATDSSIASGHVGLSVQETGTTADNFEAGTL
ncbi:MAG TPA: hypothetical protein VIY48_08925 [Candidatus Paceibacterota bacterium]